MELRGLMIWVLLMCYIFGHIISHNNGIVEAKSLSKLDDLEIEKKLKTINKPAVEIIKTNDGEEYGCVDFFKQPGFDHPSMKNHTFHYNMWEQNANNSDEGFGELWENGVGCPIGTVPIQRVNKDDLLRLHSLDHTYEPRSSWNNTTYDPNNALHSDQHHFAVARTKNIGVSYNGASMVLELTAPKVKPGQFSASRLHFRMGDEFIQFGFTVNPVLYRDDQPRTFVFTKAGGKGCYNHDCDVGMIIVRRDIPMGKAYKPVSVRFNKRVSLAPMALTRDRATGHWWMTHGVKEVKVGFWPSYRFRKSSGDYVEWGGEVFRAWKPSPQMGYGYFPLYRQRTDQFAWQLTVLDANYNIDRRVNQIEAFSDNERGYKVASGVDPRVARIVFWGGPGNI